MDGKRIEELEAICEAATAGPGGHGPLTNEDGTHTSNEGVVEWIEDSLSIGSGPVFCVVADDPHGEGQATVAITGNGPTSEANARLWATARTALPEALAALRDARHENKVLERALEIMNQRSNNNAPFIEYCKEQARKEVQNADV